MSWSLLALEPTDPGAPCAPSASAACGRPRCGVDTTGNGVLEPGETVDVRPTWRNDNGAALTFGGTLCADHRPRRRHLHDHRRHRRLRHGRRRRCCGVRRLLRRVASPTRRRARPRTGTPPRSRPSSPTPRASRRRGRSTSATASPTCRRERVLPLHRDAAAPRRDRRLHRDHVLPGRLRPRASRWRCSSSSPRRAPGYVPPACGATPMFADVPATSPFCRWIEELARRGVVGRLRRRQLLPGGAGHPRADGGLRAAHAGPGAQPAAPARTPIVRRRPRDQPVLPLDRGAGRPRRRHRLRRRQLLPGRRRSPASRWASSSP